MRYKYKAEDKYLQEEITTIYESQYLEIVTFKQKEG